MRSPWLSDLRSTAASSSLRSASPVAAIQRDSAASSSSIARSSPRGSSSAPTAVMIASFIGMRGQGDARLDRLPAVGDGLAARDLARELAEQLLGQRHQVLVGRVGLVELEHRELGVVLARQPLVAEVAADLVDALEAADDQPLEVELGRDAHVEIEIERVVVRHERPRRRAAEDRVHHRRLDLEEAARVEEAPDRAHDRGALAEDLAHVGVHHQVDVALAVADLDVLQAVPLLGQRARRLGQDDRLVGQDRQLAGAREHGAADRAHEVAALDLLPQLVGGVADLVLLHVELDLAACGRGSSRRSPCRTRGGRRCGPRPRTCRPRAAAGGAPLSALSRWPRRGGVTPANRASTSAVVWVGTKPFA